LDIIARNMRDPEALQKSLGSCHAIIQHILRLEKHSGYQVEKLLELFNIKGSAT